MSQTIRQKEIELCQNYLIFTKIFELYQVIRYSKRYQVARCPNTLKLYTLKVLLHENWINFFFFDLPGRAKILHLLGCHAIGINSSFNSFLSALRFSYLTCLTKKLS